MVPPPHPPIFSSIQLVPNRWRKNKLLTFKIVLSVLMMFGNRTVSNTPKAPPQITDFWRPSLLSSPQMFFAMKEEGLSKISRSFRSLYNLFCISGRHFEILANFIPYSFYSHHTSYKLSHFCRFEYHVNHQKFGVMAWLGTPLGASLRARLTLKIEKSK